MDLHAGTSATNPKKLPAISLPLVQPKSGVVSGLRSSHLSPPTPLSMQQEHETPMPPSTKPQFGDRPCLRPSWAPATLRQVRYGHYSRPACHICDLRCDCQIVVVQCMYTRCVDGANWYILVGRYCVWGPPAATYRANLRAFVRLVQLACMIVPFALASLFANTPSSPSLLGQTARCTPIQAASESSRRRIVRPHVCSCSSF